MNAQPAVIAAGRDADTDCEGVLRSLPMWFGKEDSLQEYVRDSAVRPTFVTRRDDGAVNAFITLRWHFAQSCEIHCMVVHAECRGQSIGRAPLVQHVEDLGGGLGRARAAGRDRRLRLVERGLSTHPRLLRAHGLRPAGNAADLGRAQSVPSAREGTGRPEMNANSRRNGSGTRRRKHSG